MCPYGSTPSYLVEGRVEGRGAEGRRRGDRVKSAIDKDFIIPLQTYDAIFDKFSSHNIPLLTISSYS